VKYENYQKKVVCCENAPSLFLRVANLLKSPPQDGVDVVNTRYDLQLRSALNVDLCLLRPSRRTIRPIMYCLLDIEYSNECIWLQ
jgi:hypothetical protein